MQDPAVVVVGCLLSTYSKKASLKRDIRFGINSTVSSANLRMSDYHLRDKSISLKAKAPSSSMIQEKGALWYFLAV